MEAIRTAVIGVGYLGKFHADKYAAAPEADLVAVCDANPETAAAIAEKHGVEAVSDYRELVGRVDAVSIVVPTQLHHEVAATLIDAGIHVLLEKPITATVEEGRDLVARAETNGVTLQVGHLERFNPAMMALREEVHQPLFIESHRLAPFNPRGADVNVVLDLMIHDIDLILDLVGAPIRELRADGIPVITEAIDIANARLKFENGCVANVTASRVSLEAQRRMRVFEHNTYMAVDFQQRKLAAHRVGDRETLTEAGIPEIETNEKVFEGGDAIREEVHDFLTAIATGRRPTVDGADGLRALETALEITKLMTYSQVEFQQLAD